MAEEEISDIVEEAKRRYALCEEHYSDEYKRADEDVEFVFGDGQWPEEIRTQRERDSQPCLTENRTLVFCNQVANNIRQLRPSVDVLPVDDKADVETAKIIKGLIRNIHVQSDADSAFDTMGWNAITAAYGWVRVNTKWCGDDTFDQECEIVRIPDYHSCMLDPASIKIDGSDSEYGFITEDMDIETFKSNYPNADPVNFEQDGLWCTDKKIRVCEYFKKVYEEKTIVETQDGVMEKSIAEELGLKINRERTIRMPSIKIYKLTGKEELEQTDWLGRYIPLVPCYGMEAWIKRKRKCLSLINQAKDPQRRFNYWLSASTEIIALQPKSPFIGLTGQFETDKAKWDTANRKSYPFIQYDTVTLDSGQEVAQPPQRQMPPQGSTAMFQEMMAAAEGIKAVIGLYDASLGNTGNETSGRAIANRQQQGDNATFHFPDNVQKAITHVGRILIDLIPKIYTGQRIVRILGDDDAEMFAPLNQAVVKTKNGYAPLQQGQDQSKANFFRPDVGKYDVVAAVGASFATKRLEMVDLFKTLFQSAPQTFEIFGDIFFKSLDIPENDLMAERMRRMYPVMQDDEDPAQAALQQAQTMVNQMQGQLEQMKTALDSKSSKENAEIQIKVDELKLKSRELDIKAAETMAKIEQMRAETVGVNQQVFAEVIQTIAGLEASMNDTAQAVQMILENEERKATVAPIEATGQGENING